MKMHVGVRIASIFLSCLFVILLLISAVELLQQALPGNLDLLVCVRAFIAKDSNISSCFGGRAADSQWQVISFLHTRDAWRNRHYEALASECGDELCACFPAVSSRTLLYERIQAYYYVVAYRMQTGRFPRLDDCAERFVSSNFLWHQARTTTERDLAETISELAYWVDQDWSNPWQRGHTAYKQAERYRNSGDTQSAQRAFEMALESLLLSEDERAPAYASWSLQALGELAVAQGDIETSIAKFRESIKVSPKNASKSFDGLVRVWNLKKYSMDYIISEFERMRRELGEHDPSLTSGPAQALLGIGVTDAAWRLIASSSQSVQSTAPVLAVQGALYEKAGNLERARQCYAEALVQTLNTVPLEAASRAADLARLAESQGNFADAIVNMELAVELNPKSAGYWYALSQLYKRKGDVRLARQSLEKALALNPKNETFLKALADLRK